MAALAGRGAGASPQVGRLLLVGIMTAGAGHHPTLRQGGLLLRPPGHLGQDPHVDGVAVTPLGAHLDRGMAALAAGPDRGLLESAGLDVGVAGEAELGAGRLTTVGALLDEEAPSLHGVMSLKGAQ